MAQPIHTLPLFAEEKPQPPEADAGSLAHEAPAQVWIAVHVPELAAEPAAAAANVSRVAASLESLAHRVYEITPMVSFEPPDGLLLEVRGSLKLFGGLDAIKVRLEEQIDGCYASWHVCAAPTPLGALWMARARDDDVLEAERLRAALNRLPLEATAWPERVRALLREMGLRRIGDCLRLPRDGFARRAGRACLQDLDKALGKAPDPRLPYRAPAELGWSIELPAESRNLDLCRGAIERMLDDLVAGLRALQYQARELEVVLHHNDRPPTVKHLELVQAVHEKNRFLQPLLIGLERLSLPAPVVAVSLRAGAMQPMQLDEAALFDGHGTGPDRGSRAVLLECLREHLGRESVHGLELVAEHRPERAWTDVAEPLARNASHRVDVSPWAHHRPLWLLSAPQPLSDAVARFGYRRVAHLEAGPERIETGWWDGGGIGRDYYTAVAERGERLWVYRDRETRDWYLHGFFG